MKSKILNFSLINHHEGWLFGGGGGGGDAWSMAMARDVTVTSIEKKTIQLKE